MLERHGAFGTEASARNSEVIHAGLYYPAASLKARLCVAGRDALYAYCARKHIAHRRCGKLLVATEAAQVPALDALVAQAAANGVRDLQRLTGAAAREIEPAVRCVAAALSPSSGIVDSHGFMRALLGDLEAAGGALALHSAFVRAHRQAGGFVIEAGRACLHARNLVNAAGLGASAVARAIDALAPQHVPRTWLAKGSYFSLAGKPPFSRLVYPMPEPGGLGIHLTLDLGGQARFGPDVEWIDGVDYAVDERRAEAFQIAIRRYWPGLADGMLQAAYAGVRPKIHGPDETGADFRLDGPAFHGVPGLANLFGIESPGLTAALAIGEHVAGLLAA